MPHLEPIALLVLLAVPWPWPARAAHADRGGHGVQASSRNEDAAATQAEDPLDRPTLPIAMAVALASVVLLAWAVAPFGWRGH